MTKWYIRLALYILAIIFFNLFALAYFLGETLPQESGTGNVQFYIMASFLLSFILLSVLIFHLIRKMIKPLGDITDLIKDLSEGHYWRRIYLQEQDGALDELAAYTNQLAGQLQMATEHQSMHAHRLQAVIRHMGSGLLYMNEKGKIVITNQVLLNLLGWKHDYHGHVYYETPLSEGIIECIRDAFTYEEEMTRQITLEKETERVQIHLSAVPIKGSLGKVSGMVLVFHDITDLKRLEETRKDFVANVSHELKTPVTSIKGFSETLLDGAMYSEKHLKEFLEIIRQESDRLYRLIQDLLDLSHIEQGELQLKWEKVDLRELVQDTLALVQPKANSKQIQLKILFTDRAEIMGDTDRIRQILLNLTSNAIQYTPEQGQVEIGIEEWEDKGYTVCIQDTGIGIKEKELPRIFERFYRVDRARSRASGGTGLGLAIVKHLVEAHHGEVKVSSVEGKGSRFCVCFYKQKPGGND